MKGTFLLDIEIELSWGFIDQQTDKKMMTQASENIRKHLDRVFMLLEKYQIPVTWGVLGHVALESCKRLKIPHPDMPRPSYKWLRKDWFEADPCSTQEAEPAFYGKDIVDRIVNFTSESKTPHDIACHSFSHQLFGDPGCSSEVAQAEIRKCLEIMRKNYRIRPTVFIFPRDSVGHEDALRDNGFIAFRGPIPHTIYYSETDSSAIGRIRRYVSLSSYFMSFYFQMSPPVVTIEEIDGLKDIPGCMCFNNKPFIPLGLVTLKAKKGIRRAIEEEKIFHLYTHDINFGLAPDIEAFLKDFEGLLVYADSQRAKKKLEITTIKKLAEISPNRRPST